MEKKLISAEKELFRLSMFNSNKIGSKHKRPLRGSYSEFFRRSAKTILLLKNPNYKNIKNINWNEVYVL